MQLGLEVGNFLLQLDYHIIEQADLVGVVFPCVGAAAGGGEHQSALTLVIRQIALERIGGNMVVHLDDGDLLGNVFQLADVAVPVVGLEQARGVLREHKRRHLVTAAEVGGKLAKE